MSDKRKTRPLFFSYHSSLITHHSMKALRFENNQLKVADVARPAREGEALVRVVLAGVCNTDLEIARGYAGFEGTLGHEFVGLVERMGADGELARPLGRAQSTEPLLTRGLMPGDRVV